MFTGEISSASQPQRPKPFLLIRFRTLFSPKNINSRVFSYLRTLEGKTPGVAYREPCLLGLGNRLSADSALGRKLLTLTHPPPGGYISPRVDAPPPVC